MISHGLGRQTGCIRQCFRLSGDSWEDPRETALASYELPRSLGQEHNSNFVGPVP